MKYGKCECTDCNEFSKCHGEGPAAYEVVRDGKKIRVCTRCDLSTDKEKKLLVTSEDSAEEYFEYDPLGAMCIAYEKGGS